MNAIIYVCGINADSKVEGLVLSGDDDELKARIAHPQFAYHVTQLLSPQVQNLDIAIIPRSETIYIRASGQDEWINFLKPGPTDTARTILDRTKCSDAIDERIRELFLAAYDEDEDLQDQCKDLEKAKFCEEDAAHSFHHYRQQALEENCKLLELWDENPLGDEELSFLEKLCQSIPPLFKQLFYCFLSFLKPPV